MRVVEAVEVQRALGAVGAAAQALGDGREPEPLVGEVAGLSREGAHGEVSLAPALEGGRGSGKVIGGLLDSPEGGWVCDVTFLIFLY